MKSDNTLLLFIAISITAILLSMLITGCGNEASVPSRIDVVTSGTATTEITITLDVLEQLKSLCTDLYETTDIPQDVKKALIAECVFAHMKDLGVSVKSIDSACQSNQLPAEICEAL